MNSEPSGGEQPLKSVRVLDLSNLLAGPMTTMYLADFGAEVIKVEQPVTGDELRRWGKSKDGVGLTFKLINRNKKTITLNLRKPEGQELVRRMVKEMDVVVENFRPGTLERWGLGYEDLKQINPKLIMARITGFGQTGPYAHQRGFGTLAETFSGYSYITGYKGQAPLLPAFGLGDTSTAIFTAYAIMMALYYRDLRNGQGQYIDSALYEGLFTLLCHPAVNYDQLGIVEERGEGQVVAPRSCYLTGDGIWAAIAGSTQRTFEAIARALGRPEWIEDPRFRNNAERVLHMQALDELIQAAVQQLTYEELERRFAATEAPLSKVMSIKQIFEDPHYHFRHNIADVEDDELGHIRMQNVVPRLSATPGKIHHAGPGIGAHNKEVYEQHLKLSAPEIEQLKQLGVI